MQPHSTLFLKPSKGAQGFLAGRHAPHAGKQGQISRDAPVAARCGVPVHADYEGDVSTSVLSARPSSFSLFLACHHTKIALQFDTILSYPSYFLCWMYRPKIVFSYTMYTLTR